MYNTAIECTYNTSEVFLDTDKINDIEKKFIRDVIYRQELLDILDITEYNEKDIQNVISDIYEKTKNCQLLKECMIKIANSFMSLDEKFGLMILFSFDYMYLTHNCISEFLETGKISDVNIIKLQNAIS